MKRLNGDFEKSSFARKIQPTNMITIEKNVFNFFKREAFHEVQHNDDWQKSFLKGFVRELWCH